MALLKYRKKEYVHKLIVSQYQSASLWFPVKGRLRVYDLFEVDCIGMVIVKELFDTIFYICAILVVKPFYFGKNPNKFPFRNAISDDSVRFKNNSDPS